MQLNSLQEMIKDYEKRTGEIVDLSKFKWIDNDLQSDENVHFKFFPHIGFLFWGIDEIDGVRYFLILHTYGNFKAMCDYMREVMELNGLTQIMTFTTRNPRVHQRRWGCKWLKDKDYVFEGKNYHVMVSDITHLDKGD